MIYWKCKITPRLINQRKGLRIENWCYILSLSVTIEFLPLARDSPSAYDGFLNFEFISVLHAIPVRISPTFLLVPLSV